MKVLGGAWHLPSAVEVLSRTILTATRGLLFGDRAIYHNWSAPAHINCNEKCLLAPQLPKDSTEELDRYATADLKNHILHYHKLPGDVNWTAWEAVLLCLHDVHWI